MGKPRGAGGRGTGMLVSGEMPGKTGPQAPQPVSLLPAALWICIWRVWGTGLISSNLPSRGLQRLRGAAGTLGICGPAGFLVVLKHEP